MKLNQCIHKDKEGANICMIEAKLPMPSLSSPPKFESFSTLPKRKKRKSIIKCHITMRETQERKKRENSYIAVTLELTQSTPCHLSPQGSNPYGTHPGSNG